MSGIINKVKDALHSDKAHEQPEGTHGPHSSRAANAADPRVDSDRDGRANPTTSTHTGGISSTGTHSTSTHGSHGHVGNAVDPSTHTSGLGSSSTHGAGGLSSGTHNAGGLSSGVGSTNTHSAGGLGSGTHSGYNDPAGSHGTHGSKMANVADPRIDSDRDHRAAPGAAGTSHIGSGPGPASNTAGPHKSDMMNKVDPRVDSDLDGSKTVGGNKTYQQTGNSSVAHKDPTDAAQVPPSVLREHVGDPDIMHNDPHHGHDRRHGSVSHQEAHVVGKNV